MTHLNEKTKIRDAKVFFPYFGNFLSKYGAPDLDDATIATLCELIEIEYPDLIKTYRDAEERHFIAKPPDLKNREVYGHLHLPEGKGNQK